MAVSALPFCPSPAPTAPRAFLAMPIGSRLAGVGLGGAAPVAAAPQQQQQRSRRGAAVRVAAAAGANVRHGAVVAKPGARFAVVVGRFNDLVTKLLLEGALGAFQSHGATMANVEVGGPAAGVRARACLVVGAPQLASRPAAASPAGCGARGNCAAPRCRGSHGPRRRRPSPARAQVCWVPGSFELPVVGKAMAKSGKFDAVICIGVVVSGAASRQRPETAAPEPAPFPSRPQPAAPRRAPTRVRGNPPPAREARAPRV